MRECGNDRTHKRLHTGTRRHLHAGTRKHLHAGTRKHLHAGTRKHLHACMQQRKIILLYSVATIGFPEDCPIKVCVLFIAQWMISSKV
jgi:hypothetical protein